MDVSLGSIKSMLASLPRGGAACVCGVTVKRAGGNLYEVAGRLVRPTTAVKGFDAALELKRLLDGADQTRGTA